MECKRPLKFEWICENLRNLVLLNDYQELEKLPSEEVLAKKYKCSRPTIRKALEKLRNDGVIMKKQGSGSFINKNYLNSKEVTVETPTNAKCDSFMGLIFPNLGTRYVFDSISNYVATYLAESGYSLIWGGYLSPLSPTFMQEVSQICNRYIKLRVKGVFFSPFEYSEKKDEVNHFVLSTLSQAKIPVVLLDSDVDDFPQRNSFDLISLDHIAECYKLSSHLLDQGISRLIFFAPPSSMETIRLRLVGYHEAMIDHGIIPKKEYHVIMNPEDVLEVKKMFNTLDPEGIMCSNDGTAILLMRTLEKLNIRIPEQVLMAGFDNLSYLADIKIPLTSISQPVEAMGQLAVQAMLQRIKNPNTPIATVRLPGKMFIRQSSLKLKGN